MMTEQRNLELVSLSVQIIPLLDRWLIAPNPPAHDMRSGQYRPCHDVCSGQGYTRDFSVQPKAATYHDVGISRAPTKCHLSRRVFPVQPQKCPPAPKPVSVGTGETWTDWTRGTFEGYEVNRRPEIKPQVLSFS